MLTRAQEECAIDQRIPIEDMQGLLAKSAGHLRLLLPRQRRQDKQTRIIVAMVTLVLNLQQNKSNLRLANRMRIV